jgi:ankyrin repeat protein
MAETEAYEASEEGTAAAPSEPVSAPEEDDDDVLALARENAALTNEVSRLEAAVQRETQGEDERDSPGMASERVDDLQAAAALDEGAPAIEDETERARLIEDLRSIDERLLEKREAVAATQVRLQALRDEFEEVERAQTRASTQYAGEARDLRRQLKVLEKKRTLTKSLSNDEFHSRPHKVKLRVSSKSKSKSDLSSSTRDKSNNTASSSSSSSSSKGSAKGSRSHPVAAPVPAPKKPIKTPMTAAGLLGLIQRGDMVALAAFFERKLSLAIFSDFVDGQTVLQHTLRSPNEKIVDLMLSVYRRNNLDVNAQDRFGWTAFHVACYEVSGTPRDARMISKLLDFATLDVTIPNQDGNTCLHYFCQAYRSAFDVRKTLLRILARAADGVVFDESSGALAASNPSERGELARFVNAANRNGETALHKAMFNGNCRVIILESLLEHGADTRIPTKRGNETALHYAARLGRTDLLRILLKAGAVRNGLLFFCVAKTNGVLTTFFFPLFPCGGGFQPFILTTKHQPRTNERTFIPLITRVCIYF